jgi:hypothetical protein
LPTDKSNWPLAKRQMVLALRFKGYDFPFVSDGGAILSESPR